MEPKESGDTYEQVDYLLFSPKSGKDLRQYYPELGRTKEFEPLSQRELLFVWYYACKSSTIPKEVATKEGKCMYAFEIAFGKVTLNEELYAKYRALNFPERVRIAIERMERYEPDFRNKARQMTMKMFNNLQKLSDINTNDLVLKHEETGQEVVDWDARKKYIDSCERITSVLPELLKQLEEGFGVTDDKKKEKGRSAIDKFHASKIE